MNVNKLNRRQTGLPREIAGSCYSIRKSPIGDLMLVADDSALIGLYFVGCNHLPNTSRNWKRQDNHPVLQQAAQQLQEYFAGTRELFSIPLQLAGTEFQEKIWREIARIPYGKTVTYSELARRAGTPQAIRAAGTSTGRNPISIIIPCHRVVGKNGSMTGFAGGLDRKRHLLELEKSRASLSP